MLRIGDYNRLTVLRLFRGGCVLDGGEEGELYLTKRDTPVGTRRGDRLRVFVFNESKDRLGVTTVEPNAKVGDFAAMVVSSAAQFGLFLEWGISKDLFVPKKHLPQREKQTSGAGDILVVHLILDYEKRGVIGTTHLSSHFDRDTSGLTANQEVDLIVYSITKLGAQVVIDNRWEGLLYHGEIFEPLRAGDRKKGYVKKIREDGLIDAALRPQGFVPASQEAGRTILKALEKEDGFLPLHDKSDPKEIRRRLQMSKKLYKNTIGVLYKEGLVEIRDDGIAWNTTEQKNSTEN
jgi:uncharacterized protein